MVTSKSRADGPTTQAPDSIGQSQAAVESVRRADLYRRRQEMLRLVCRHFCGNNAAELARRIDKSQNYVGRCFYPQDKAGAKGVGVVLMDAVTAAFPLPQGFWDMEPQQAEAALGAKPDMVRPPLGARGRWPDAAAVPSPIARALIEKLTAVAVAGRLPDERALEWLGELVRLES